MCLGDIGTVTAVWEENGLPMARVESATTSRVVCAIYTPEVVPGVTVHAHLGFVTEVLDAEQAAGAIALRALASGKEDET